MMFPPDIERHGKLLLLAVIVIFIVKHVWTIAKAAHVHFGG